MSGDTVNRSMLLTIHQSFLMVFYQRQTTTNASDDFNGQPTNQFLMLKSLSQVELGLQLHGASLSMPAFAALASSDRLPVPNTCTHVNGHNDCHFILFKIFYRTARHYFPIIDYTVLNRRFNLILILGQNLNRKINCIFSNLTCSMVFFFFCKSFIFPPDSLSHATTYIISLLKLFIFILQFLFFIHPNYIPLTFYSNSPFYFLYH